MQETFAVDDPARRGALLDEIHDWWFSMSDVKYDVNSRTLTVPLRRSSRSAPAAAQKTLVFGSVLGHVMQDTQGVDSYDVNTIQWDAKRGVILVNTGIPSHFEVQSAAPQVTLVKE